MFKLKGSKTTIAAFGLMLWTGIAHATTPVTPLIPTPASPSVAVNWTLGGSAGSPVTVSLAVSVATGTAFYTVDPTTVPAWLSISAMSGTATTTASANQLSFNMSSVAGTMGAGVYSTTVHVVVFGFQDLTIPVTGTIKPATSVLSVTGGATQFSALTWSIGSSIPTVSFSAASSNLPISFTAAGSSTTTSTGAIASWATVNHTTGVAYTWGTPLSVTFNPLAFLEAKAGDVLSASVLLTPASGSAVTVNIQYTVTPPVATIGNLAPSQVAVDTNASDTVTVVINGTGFITGPTGQTTLVTLNGATDSQVTVNVVSSTVITMTIPANATAAYLASEGTVTIGTYNPNGGLVSSPTSTSTLTVTSSPIINSITSVATYLVPSTGNPTFAPYDVVAIFGTNLCPDCGGSNPAQLTGTPDGTYFRYPKTLSPDSGAHTVAVDFQQTATGNAVVGPGYLLFASNNQINVLVPAGVASNIGTGTVQMLVNYTTTSGPTTLSSTPYVINIAAADPGILTLNADGQGQGAILLPDFSVNSSTNKATHSPAQTVMVYLAGMGAPTSTAANTATSTALAYPASCIAPLTGYMATVNASASGYTPPSPAWTNIDGAVMHSGFIATGHFPPCMAGVTATINGVTATVTYAGFVSDAIAGLYQVNVTIPSSPGTIPSGGQVPISITIGGKTTQPGVTMYIQ